ncbi:MAG: HEAT repeat domain-containing protein, partial [Thermoanaerobaculia bacterium]|nr:HEAT repeat domain-containing protein [Thermoanaerobaculia bacterium]
VLVALDDPEPAVRASAARALAGLGAPVVPALRHVVDSGSPEAAQAAVGALRWTETSEARRELMEIAAGHPDDGVRALARLALGRPLDAEDH